MASFGPQLFTTNVLLILGILRKFTTIQRRIYLQTMSIPLRFPSATPFLEIPPRRTQELTLVAGSQRAPGIRRIARNAIEPGREGLFVRLGHLAPTTADDGVLFCCCFLRNEALGCWTTDVMDLHFVKACVFFFADLFGYFVVGD